MIGANLNVIVEAQDLVAKPMQDSECPVGAEVFKLDEAVRPLLLHSVHKLLHHSHVLISFQPLLSVALQCTRRLSLLAHVTLLAGYNKSEDCQIVVLSMQIITTKPCPGTKTWATDAGT